MANEAQSEISFLVPTSVTNLFCLGSAVSPAVKQTTQQLKKFT
jgi:hypothetical protein